MTWSNLLQDAKLELVNKLQHLRTTLVKQAKEARVRKSPKRRSKKMTFKTPELEKLFYSMPADLQEFVMEK